MVACIASVFVGLGLLGVFFRLMMVHHTCDVFVQHGHVDRRVALKEILAC